MAVAPSPLSDQLAELVTLIVVPKDWYSHALEGLHVLRRQYPRVHLLYCLSSPCPAELEVELHAESERSSTLTVLRSEPLASPYEMRQAAAARVTTPYYAVLGNDTWGDEGWLEKLVETAEAEPTAAVIQPLILERSVTHNDTLHVWWNPIRLITTRRGDILSTSFDNAMVRLKPPELQKILRPRCELAFIEDHALLVRTAAFPTHKPPLWDARASARREFFDLAWTVAASGHRAILEPYAVVTYRKVRPLKVDDLAFFVARRHDEACVRAMAYLDRKWRICTRMDRWHESHRDEALTGTVFEGAALPYDMMGSLRLVLCLLGLLGMNRFRMHWCSSEEMVSRKPTSRRSCAPSSRTASSSLCADEACTEGDEEQRWQDEMDVVGALRAVDGFVSNAGTDRWGRCCLGIDASQSRIDVRHLHTDESAVYSPFSMLMGGEKAHNAMANDLETVPSLSSLSYSGVVLLQPCSLIAEEDQALRQLEELSVIPYSSFALFCLHGVKKRSFLSDVLVPLASACFRAGASAARGAGGTDERLDIWLWLRDAASATERVKNRLATICTVQGAQLSAVWNEASPAALLRLAWPLQLVRWAYKPLRVDELIHAMSAIETRTQVGSRCQSTTMEWGRQLKSRIVRALRLSSRRPLSRRATLVLCNPFMPECTISLEFVVRPTAVAARWLQQLEFLQRRSIGIKYRRRFYAFPHDERTLASVASELTAAAAVLNAWVPGVVPEHLLQGRACHIAIPQLVQEDCTTRTPEISTEMTQLAMGGEMMYGDGQAREWEGGYSQLQLNALHKVFEDLRGSIEAPAVFFVNAPLCVQEALEDFNLHIHRLEDMHRQRERIEKGQPTTPRVTVAFDHGRPRIPLLDCDLQHFSVQMSFGTLYLNYCVVGKHLLELFQDDDDACGGDNVRPQRMMSADVQGYFGPSMSDEEASLRLANFFDWLRASPERRARWGALDEKLCLGRIPVADLDRDCHALEGLSEPEIVELIGRHQCACALTVDPSAPNQSRKQ